MRYRTRGSIPGEMEATFFKDEFALRLACPTNEANELEKDFDAELFFRFSTFVLSKMIAWAPDQGANEGGLGPHIFSAWRSLQRFVILALVRLARRPRAPRGEPRGGARGSGRTLSCHPNEFVAKGRRGPSGEIPSLLDAQGDF
jgi:hypothetical protein